MKSIPYLQIIWGILFVVVSCSSTERPEPENDKTPEPEIPVHSARINYSGLLEKAAAQYLFLKNELNGADAFPKNYDKTKNVMETTSSEWWCSGFYPGTLLYLYEYSGNKELYREAMRMLTLLTPEQYNVNTHDIGFMMYCSYGNAYRLEPKPQYKQILMNSANSLITRFNPVVGCIRSHDRKPGDFVVIIDNMMNLELLFWASMQSGDPLYYDLAVIHANTTLKNHFRVNNSLYHGINYHPETGAIRHYQAGQGYAEQSAWSRGQAWGLYGYTLMYRYTKDEIYLQKARDIAGFLFSHPNMPPDKVPYWDFDTPDIPFTLRDASAAAISCSALLELYRYVPEPESETYFGYAEDILASLSSPAYSASQNSNGGFILMHSVGNMPSKTEIDVAISYADYYYVEALMRYRQIIENKVTDTIHITQGIAPGSVKTSLQDLNK